MSSKFGTPSRERAFPLRSSTSNCVGANSYGVPVFRKTDIVPGPLGGRQDPPRRPRQCREQRQRGSRETDHLGSGFGVLKAKTSTVQCQPLPTADARISPRRAPVRSRSLIAALATQGNEPSASISTRASPRIPTSVSVRKRSVFRPRNGLTPLVGLLEQFPDLPRRSSLPKARTTRGTRCPSRP